MKIKFSNKGYGLIVFNTKLGKTTYKITLMYNSRDLAWMISIAGELTGTRVSTGRQLFSNEYGYLLAEGDGSKEDLNELTWVDA
jgi:hypothetical protein